MIKALRENESEIWIEGSHPLESGDWKFKVSKRPFFILPNEFEPIAILIVRVDDRIEIVTDFVKNGKFQRKENPINISQAEILGYVHEMREEQ